MDDRFLQAYLAAWSAACVAAIVLFVRDPSAFAVSRRAYWLFLREPWKLATFAVATAGMVLVAPFTGDPTWDYFDAFFMSALTYATAPWAVGVAFLAARGRSTAREAFVAACAWMFSASWSYDLYILLRDGVYPATWAVNIAAASVLYVSAGLLWNLEHHPGRGVIFAFLREGWPSPSADPRFSRLFWIAAPFMAIAAASVGYFLLSHAGTIAQ